MSGRGRGGGRRTTRAGGGDGGGRGRGGGGGRGGRSGRFPTPSPSESFPPLGNPSSSSSSSQFPSLPTPAPVPVSAASRPASSSTGGLPTSSSSSTSAATLSREVEKLTLQSATPSPASAPGANLPPASSKNLKPPNRPGFGTVGQKVIIRANHFLVEVADKDLHQYDVTITPELKCKKASRLLINELVRLYKESHLGKRTSAYDGGSRLYTAGPLPFERKEFIVELVDKDKKAGSAEKDNQAASARRERPYTVAIKFVAKADIHHLQQFLAGRQREVPQAVIQALAVVLRESPSKDWTVVGRSFFGVQLGSIGELGDGLEYWRGFYQSIRPTQMGLSLNIDVSATAFYEPLFVTDFIKKYLNLTGLAGFLDLRDQDKVSKALTGLKVEVFHLEYVRRYKVTGVSVLPTDELMFSDQGRQISVAEYFRESYSIVLKYPLLPALQVGSEPKPVYLPMEVCKIVRGQRFSKILNAKQVTKLLRATCQRPADREESIKKIVIGNQYNEKQVNKEFGIHVSNGLTVVNARVLPAPRLKYYHTSGQEANVDPREGQWNMINKKMVNGGTVDYWTCISFSSRLREEMVRQFCQELVGMCSSKGIVFNPNPLLPISSRHPEQLEKALLEVHSQSTARLASMGQNGKQLQLLIIVLPDVSGSYGEIKRVCETELGIVSQCIQPHQAQKADKQYLENVSLKTVGGRNTVLSDAINRRIPLVSDSDIPTIIFGAEVTHPQPGKNSSPSIAAVVASMDWPEVTKYRGLFSAQTPGREIIEDLYKVTDDAQGGVVHGGMIRELLMAFNRSTNHKPGRIIFYRDGVGEGQFNEVLLLEVDAIRKACVSIEVNYLPKVTFVVAQKRHHTRFFADDRNQMDRSGNISPGTVVDTTICHPTEFDFYLKSHPGVSGTSHYHVLFDENNFSADELQMLTNNLCYTYARCTQSSSIVPPVYYAHLVAYRARYYIDGIGTLPAIKENVKNFMYYC